MSPEEKDLRDRAEIIHRSYAFWDNEIHTTLLEADNLVADFDGSEEEHEEYIELQEKMLYLMGHVEFEKKEMAKIEKEIAEFVKEDDEE